MFSLNRLWTLRIGLNSPSLRNRVNSGGWGRMNGWESIYCPGKVKKQNLSLVPSLEPFKKFDVGGWVLKPILVISLNLKSSVINRYSASKIDSASIKTHTNNPKPPRTILETINKAK